MTADARFDLRPAPELTADLFDGAYQTPAQVVLGPLTPGLSSYQGALAGLCPSACRLVDLSVTWGPPLPDSVTSGSVHLLVSSMATRSGAGRWRPLAAGLTDAGRWRTTAGSATLGSSAAGLASRMYVSAYGAPTAIAPADVPRALPTVLTDSLAEGDREAGGSVTVVGLDGATIGATSVGQVPSLPRVGDDASLVDLDMAQRFLSGPMTDDTTEVWLSPRAPADLDRPPRRPGGHGAGRRQLPVAAGGARSRRTARSRSRCSWCRRWPPASSPSGRRCSRPSSRPDGVGGSSPRCTPWASRVASSADPSCSSRSSRSARRSSSGRRRGWWRRRWPSDRSPSPRG